MTTSRVWVAAACLLFAACADDDSGSSIDGGSGAGGAAGNTGTGGAAGALIGDTGCSFVTPTFPPPEVQCATGCTRIPGVSQSDGMLYQVACVLDESLVRMTPGTANQICMTSPVDRQDYRVGNPIIAQAVAEACWVGCGQSPTSEAFQQWLEMEYALWLERCAEIWNL